MNNIIKSQRFLCKQHIVSICALFLTALYLTFVSIFSDEGINGLSPQVLAGGSFILVLLTGLIPVLILCFGYMQRIQLYEIMAGFSPSQIILGKTAVYLPITLAYLTAVTAVYLIADRSTEMICTLILFWVLCLRCTLCVVFLSPFCKEGSFAPLLSVFVLAIMQLYAEIGGSVEGFSHSVFSLTCFGQCGLLGGEITDSFMRKVILSSFIACVIYYLIGYLTLKKKIDLEPHSLC